MDRTKNAGALDVIVEAVSLAEHITARRTDNDMDITPVERREARKLLRELARLEFALRIQIFRLKIACFFAGKRKA